MILLIKRWKQSWDTVGNVLALSKNCNLGGL